MSEIIGDDCLGVLITDRRGVFDARALDGVRKKCFAHMLHSTFEVTGMKKRRANDSGLHIGVVLHELLKAEASGTKVKWPRRSTSSRS